MIRSAAVAIALLCLAACSHESVRTGLEPVAAVPFNPCAPTRSHDERDYTPGGLYRPGEADSGPDVAIDVSSIAEPVPRDEPRSRYGNRSPYTVLGRVYHLLDSADGYVERGIASWYGSKFNGRSTSSGEPYDICSFTAAHKTLPLPSYARVTNLDNGRSVIVRVNDRGPFHEGRLIDLSYAAAVRLGVDRTGTAHVEVRALSAGEGPSRPSLPANDRVTVQIGSFGLRDNARGLADRLEGADIDHVDIDRVDVDGRTLWRVLVGPVAADELDALLSRLRRLGIADPRVFRQ